jgi:transcription antitermination factor NusG
MNSGYHSKFRPDGLPEKNWYALYTRPRWEKKVSQLLDERRIENYLPLQKVLKQWSDRKKWVQEPLFRSYIFVHITPDDYLPALQTSGVVRFVTFERKAVTIPPVQIEAIKTYIQTGEELLQEIPNVKTGDRVVVIRGSLKGLEGTLVQVSNKKRIRIVIDGIQQSLHIKVPLSYIRVLSHSEQ